MKKIISIVLCLVIVFSIFTIIPFEVVAKDVIKTSSTKTIGDFECEIYDSFTLEIVKYNGNNSKIVIPDYIDNYKVTGIGYNAFAGNISLSNLIIGNNIEYIGDCAFIDCTNLLSVYVPNNVNFIGTYAFGYLSPLPDHAFTPYYSNFTIYASSNSQAKTYANNNNFRFIEITEDDTLSIIGDSDKNQLVDVIDATTIQKCLAELIPEQRIDKLSSDVNSDKIIDVIDSTRIQKYLAELSNLDGTIPYDSTKEINNKKTVIISNAIELNNLNLNIYIGSKIEFKNVSIVHNHMSESSNFNIVFQGSNDSPDLAMVVKSSKYDLDNFVDKTISGVARIVQLNNESYLIALLDIIDIY